MRPPPVAELSKGMNQMRDEDWKTLMKALSIYAQGVHFSKGTTQREQNAIADHMIGVAEVIENYRQPLYIEAMAAANIRLRKELDAALLQLGDSERNNESLRKQLSDADQLNGELRERAEAGQHFHTVWRSHPDLKKIWEDSEAGRRLDAACAEKRVDPSPHSDWCSRRGLMTPLNERCPMCGMP